MNKNGLPQGVWKYYNENGSLREIRRFKNGCKEGRWLSGDLSKIAYLGDICIDMSKPKSQETIEKLEKRLQIKKSFFEKGELVSENYFDLK